MAEKKIINFFDPEVQRIVEREGCSVYKMKNDTGEGIVTRYEVFPGINLMYNDFHMSNGYNQNKLPCEEVIEINHCREGRFECECVNGDCLYIGEGDMAIGMLTTETKSTSFPLYHYHGVSITLYLPEATKTLQKIADFMEDVPIDLYNIHKKICELGGYYIMRAENAISHIFSELYTAPTYVLHKYFRLKVMELILYLSILEPSKCQEEKRYFNKSQVDTVKEIRNYMIININKHYTLDELSDKFHMALTSMKTCFKGVYGTSIYAYMKSYRVQAAAKLLKGTNDSITVIAEKMGYENPSKFSEVFKKEKGILPSEYRKKSV